MLSVVAHREVEYMVEYVDDVYPLVPQRSSMLSYLELCKPGAVIKHSIEFGGVDAEKMDGDEWKIAADGGRFISNRAWVQLMRESVDGDPDVVLVAIEPSDFVAVKRELIEHEEAEMDKAALALAENPPSCVCRSAQEFRPSRRAICLCGICHRQGF